MLHDVDQLFQGDTMEMIIRQREDKATAGFAYTVRFHDRGIPVFHGSTASLAKLHKILDEYFEQPRTSARRPRRSR
jgi:hypothetical protein